jgi:hypothetical protein
MPHPRSKKLKARAGRASSEPLRKRRLAEASVAREQATHPTFAIGHPVSHPKFGDGSVTAIDDGTLTIGFADHKVRHILDHYVQGQKK